MCGRWYLPIFLFRDGSLTLISSDLRKPCLKTGKSLSPPTKLILFMRKSLTTRIVVFLYRSLSLGRTLHIIHSTQSSALLSSFLTRDEQVERMDNVGIFMNEPSVMIGES